MQERYEPSPRHSGVRYSVEKQRHCISGYGKGTLWGFNSRLLYLHELLHHHTALMAAVAVRRIAVWEVLYYKVRSMLCAVVHTSSTANRETFGIPKPFIRR
jgi:hypothetical protein